MSKIKLLSIIAISLLVTNLALIGFMFFGKSKHQPIDRKHVVIEKLNFDDKQIIEFEKLIDLHQKEISDTDTEIRTLKNKLYGTLITDTIIGLRDSLINEIGKKQIKIETIHLNHFTLVKKLCRPEQQAAFIDFSTELAKFLSPLLPPRRENNK